MAEVPFTAFVLVAGGLGERLGYSGIKLALPTESATGASYLQLYCESLLALQARTGCGPLPLALMTSGDTHARTEAMLREHAYFGLEPCQVTLMMQEKVPCLADNDARIALDGKDGFSLQTKPHGHGDVHALLHSTARPMRRRRRAPPSLSARRGWRLRGWPRGASGSSSSRTPTRWCSRPSPPRWAPQRAPASTSTPSACLARRARSRAVPAHRTHPAPSGQGGHRRHRQADARGREQHDGERGV